MDKYRINQAGLLDRLAAWDSFLKRKVWLIACGGTAMTLLGIKESTKDIDLIVPVEKEHDYLLKILLELGYRNVSGWGWARDDDFTFDWEDLYMRFRETALYDVSEDKVIKNWEHFVRLAKKEGLYREKS